MRAAIVIALGASLALAVAPPPPAVPDAAAGAEGLEDALRNLKASMVTTPVLSPEDAQRRFKLRDGLKVDLIASEPVVKQPLNINFDERGRMWVTQYRQYPVPAGLKVVSYDRYIRAKFDKVPTPPPDHFPGSDRITIHEDVMGNGTFSKVTTFLDGLNIATSALPGKGGVWVMNPPYLLFYPTTMDDKPLRPVVHLSGFGLEDTHAVASSLTWGPDGWIYGAQGSTCTAKVKVEVTRETTTTDFLGQAIWRYHPTQHRFDIFAEGGGNTFGVAFDAMGRVYSGTNWGKYRGLHYVQGGYYVKGWGKHGPLTNPYALGYFEHMPHEGNADRLAHTFLIYGAELLSDFNGKILSVNSLQRRLQVTELLPSRSTFTTREEPFLMTTDDGRFRPVDMKVGQDGALYIADMYEPRINHVDPRDNWDKATGRLWRVRPVEFRGRRPFNVNEMTTPELVEMLDNFGSVDRYGAGRVLGWRGDVSAIGPLIKLFEQPNWHALEALWALHQMGALDERLMLIALGHKQEHVRRWAVRLVGDDRTATEAVAAALARLALEEKNAEVRSQLASTAKRLPPRPALAILRGLWAGDDSADPHIPLLTWWALEAHTAERDAVVELLADATVRARPVVRKFIMERVAQRWVMSAQDGDFLAAARLLRASGDDAGLVLAGLERGFEGRDCTSLRGPLRDAIFAAWASGRRQGELTLGLRMGHGPAVKRALALLADASAPLAERKAVVRILGEAGLSDAVPVMLKALHTPGLRADVLAALSIYPHDEIAAKVIALGLHKTPEGLALLSNRAAWGRQLLAEVTAKRLDARAIPLDIVQKLALHKELADDITKHYGRVRGSSPKEKQAALVRYLTVLKKSKGDARAGAAVYKNACGKCHKLFGEGGSVGPELTGYERSNVVYWLENVIDPSAQIREEYLSFVVRTTNGQTLTGIVSGQDKTTVSLRDPEGRETKLARTRIEDMAASPVSLMPEGQLRELTDEQVRDLFAYLTKP